MRTLSDESNPITHSNIYERSGMLERERQAVSVLHPPDTVVSAATGHQRGERRGRGDGKQYFEDRNKKLHLQRNQEQSSSGVLRSVRVYIGGYLSGTTDIEMKRIISLAGGTTLYVTWWSRILKYHVLTPQQTDIKRGNTHFDIAAA